MADRWDLEITFQIRWDLAILIWHRSRLNLHHITPQIVRPADTVRSLKIQTGEDTTKVSFCLVHIWTKRRNFESTGRYSTSTTLAETRYRQHDRMWTAERLGRFSFVLRFLRSIVDLPNEPETDVVFAFGRELAARVSDVGSYCQPSLSKATKVWEFSR